MITWCITEDDAVFVTPIELVLVVVGAPEHTVVTSRKLAPLAEIETLS
jgi:hypothetical protein